MPLLSALEEELRLAAPTGPFGGYSGNRSQGVTHWPDYKQLSDADWRTVDQVRNGELKEAIIVMPSAYYLFQHCDSGVASADYTQGKLWGYTVRRLNLPVTPRSEAVRGEESVEIPSIARVRNDGGKGIYMILGAIIAATALVLGGAGGFIGGRNTTVPEGGNSDVSAELKAEQQDLTTLKNDLAAQKQDLTTLKNELAEVKHQLTPESLRASVEKALFESGTTGSVADRLSRRIAEMIAQKKTQPH